MFELNISKDWMVCKCKFAAVTISLLLGIMVLFGFSVCDVFFHPSNFVYMCLTGNMFAKLAAELPREHILKHHLETFSVLVVVSPAKEGQSRS